MKRQEAEKLLAALIFDDLDERSKADLQAYLQTDDELRERLADMRMAVKVATDTLAHGPEPILSDQRLKHLAKLAKNQRRSPWIVTLRRFAVAAVILFVAALLFSPVLHRTMNHSAGVAARHEARMSELSQAIAADGHGDQVHLELTGGSAIPIVVDKVEKPVSHERLVEESPAAEPLTVVARSSARRTPAVDQDTSDESHRGYTTETAGKDVRYGGGVYTVPGRQVADARKPAPVPGQESVLDLESQNADVLSTSVRGRQGGTVGGPGEPIAVQIDGTAVPSLSNSSVVANEPVADGYVVSPGDSPVGGSGDSVVSYQWQGNVTPSREPVTFTGEVSSETSSIKQNKNERAETLAKVSELESSDRKATTGDLYFNFSGAISEPQLEAESKSEPSSGIVNTSEKLELFKRLKEVSDVSGPETDVEEEAKKRLGQRMTTLSVASDPNMTAEKYDADLALPGASRFKVVPVNPWVMTGRDALSTFALDVDTASYTLSRRYIQSGFLPPIGAVRMEEFINYFDYQYPQRSTPTFAVHAEAAPSPFARQDKNLTLLKIGVKARTLGRDQQRPAHLVFVIDASASMGQADRLPLIQESLGLLIDKLSPADRVSLITCAEQGRLHLEAVPAGQRDKVRQAIDAIQPAGPTNLLAGFELGYAVARGYFTPNQINHVVLCSDGVANVGQTEAEAVLQAVAKDRKQGITLTCIGVGYGTYNDAFLESLANQGDGSYLFLDSPKQARETFVEKFSAALQVVAKDARIQVSFNPQCVRRYRLIGYENRDIEDARFRDDTVDAGEVGSGQCSTALYELELIGQPSTDGAGDLGTVYVRYRDVESGQMEEISSRLTDAMVGRPTVSDNPRFFLAAAAARFAEWLRQSEHTQDANLSEVLATIEEISLTLPLDRDVSELAELIRKAEHLPRAP